MNPKIVKFYKYQGAGNDFVMIDNRNGALQKDNATWIKQVCDRRFGVGADGLIFIQNCEGYDFEMVYFNADGYEGTMCGNGGRCAVAFAQQLGIIQDKTRFLAVDGEHEAQIEAAEVALKMSDVHAVEVQNDYFVLDTGSPHYVRFVPDLEGVQVFEEGRKVRYNERFQAKGINVNFAEATPEGIAVATYERGVEAETLACGTGVTACALAHWLRFRTKTHLPIRTKGGELAVWFEPISDQHFQNIWLKGGATFVFEGEISYSTCQP